VANKAIDMELEFKIPAEHAKTDPKQWDNLIKMQIYLGNVKGSLAFKDIIDNSYADKAAKTVKLAK
jgi:NitT/TauT family transport system substrate-binding protein